MRAWTTGVGYQTHVCEDEDETPWGVSAWAAICSHAENWSNKHRDTNASMQTHTHTIYICIHTHEYTYTYTQTQTQTHTGKHIHKHIKVAAALACGHSSHRSEKLRQTETTAKLYKWSTEHWPYYCFDIYLSNSGTMTPLKRCS